MSEIQSPRRRLPTPDAAPPAPATSSAAAWSLPRNGTPALPLRAFLRTRRTGVLLALVALGVLVSTVLLGTVPLYSELVPDVQLQALLTSQPVQDVNAETVITTASEDEATADQIDRIAGSLGHQLLGGFAPHMTEFLDATPLLFTSLNGHVVAVGPTQPYSDLAQSRARPFTFDYTAALPHMRLFAGRLPLDVPAGQMPEVLATPKLGVHVGDTIGLQASGANATVVARVVGIWFPKDPNDPFWNGHDYDTTDLCLLNCPPPQYPLLFTRGGFYATLASFAQGQSSSNIYFAYSYRVYLHYIYFTEPTRLTAHNLPAALANFTLYHTRMNASLSYSSGVYGLQVATRLDTLLAGLQRQFALLAQPLYIVVAQIAAFALLFVATVVALLIEERGGTVAALRSRGASRPQIVATLLLLSIVPAALAAAGGLFLATGLALSLIHALEPATSPAAESYLASAASPTTALAGCALGCALSLLAVAAASWQAAGRTLVAYQQEQARGEQVPFWKRRYLDIALAALCLVGYVELGRFGSLDVREQLGQSATSTPDPLQVAAPLLLLLAGALIVLRLLRPIATALARLAARGRGAVRMLAFSQVARASQTFTRLTLLLTFAVALSIFALTFRATLDRHAADRAAYAAGGDQLMMLAPIIQQSQYADLMRSHVGQLPGVRDATPVERIPASATQDEGSGSIEMLGIAPDSFASVVYWRDDYAAEPLPALLTDMRRNEAGTQAGDDSHPIWALVSERLATSLRLRPGDRFTLRLRTGAQGTLALRVGAIVSHFPTMYSGSGDAGWLVVADSDLLAALANVNIGNLTNSSATEYWLRTTGRPADDVARAAALRQLQLELLVPTVIDRRALAAQYQRDPVSAGMGRLLALGALLAALLSGIACLVYATTAAQRRQRSFAVLRTLGMSAGQVRSLALGESAVMYLTGLAGGLALGAVLSTATLPFLDYTSALQDPATVGVPPVILAFSPAALGALCAALLLFFTLAFVLQAALTRRDLGTALRWDEG